MSSRRVAWRAQDVELLRSIVRRREPKLMAWVNDIGRTALTTEAREELRDALLEELLEKGLAKDDEPNTYGKKVDDLIGALGNF